jgi:serine protease Do
MTRLLLLFSFLLAGVGCMHSPQRLARQDARIFAAQERAAQKALEAVGDSLVLFTVEETGGNSRERNRTVSFSGLVLTEDGYLLAPVTLEPNSGNRIEVYIGEDRYIGRAVETDDSIGMSLVKIEPSEPLSPIDTSVENPLLPGQTAFTVIGSDESSEYARFVFNTFCQGMIQGRYRQFALSPVPSRSRGAPLYNQTGQLVGIVNQANAFVLSDLEANLDEMLTKANGEAEETPEDEDAWFGAMLAPINPDYARANNLPRSALWLVYVYEDSSAAEAGFQSGDLLIRLNGEPLRLSGSRAYQYFLQTLRPRKGKSYTATVLRNGKEIQGSATITNREEPDTLRAEDLGITVSDINEPMVVSLNLRQSEGVVVTDIEPGSPAATGRTFGQPLLRPRDLVVSIGGIPTPDIESFNRALDQIRQEKRKDLLVTFWRGPVSGVEALNLRIGEQENGDGA